jgi:NAD(P)-dependent dehydrogenase (short-subunit alcohol dehydrogenase family)
MSDSLDMTGRVVLVTGGTQGIGRAVADRFASAGASVTVSARRDPGDDFPHRFLRCDVRNASEVDEMVHTLVMSTGHLDVVVHSAGGAGFAPAATASPRYHAAVIDLNLVAALHVFQRANAQMQNQPDGGSLVAISSLSGMRPSPGTAAYGAAKAGLIALVQSLAVEWGPKVRVNTVSAGLVETAQTRDLYGEDMLDALRAEVPLGRLCLPEDVADACLFLASSLARFVSGANLVVHGGGEGAVRSTGWSTTGAGTDLGGRAN